MTDSKPAAELSEEEKHLYDRQIRLWGFESQKRLRTVSVLVIGMNGLGAEVAKNVVLAGVKSVTLMDHKDVSKEDFSSHFMVRRSDLGNNRAECSREYAQRLNPNVTIVVNTSNIEQKLDDAEFFRTFDVVCVTEMFATNTLTKINELCRVAGAKFILGHVWGCHGFFFSDLLEHDYVQDVSSLPKLKQKNGDGEPEPKKAKVEEDTTVVIKKHMSFVPLSRALQVKSCGKADVGINNKTSPVLFIVHVLLRFHSEEGRRPGEGDLEKLEKLKRQVAADLDVNEDRIESRFFEQIFGELSPSAAIVGGILAQEVIKVASCKDAPLRNMFLFDGDECCGMVEQIGC